MSFATRNVNTTGQAHSDALEQLEELFAREELKDLRNEYVEGLLAEGRRDHAAFQGLIHHGIDN